jgi:hypothetical protein
MVKLFDGQPGGVLKKAAEGAIIAANLSGIAVSRQWHILVPVFLIYNAFLREEKWHESPVLWPCKAIPEF